MKLVVVVAVLALGCGKGSSKESDKVGSAAAQPAAAKPTAPKLKRIGSLPLQGEAGEGWKIADDKVTGGVSLRTATASIGIAKDPPAGLKKTTLEDEKRRMSEMSAPPQEVREDKLTDGWSLSYKVPGMLPYDATLLREIGGQGYRCAITAETAAERAEAIAICRSLEP